VNVCNVCVHIYIYIYSNQNVICVVCMYKNVCSHQNKEEKPLGSVCISYVKDVSEKFRRVGNRSNIRMIFKTKCSEERRFTQTIWHYIPEDGIIHKYMFI
jgi:hypothetical protein